MLGIANASASNCASLQLNVSSGTNAQKFIFKKASNGFYYIINLNSGMALDVDSGGLASGIRVQQYILAEECDNQLWSLQKNNDESYTIISKVNGLALDIAGGKANNGVSIQTWELNGSDTQKFSLESEIISDKAVSNGR